MDYRVVFAPEAEEQLAELYKYIAKEATPDTALRYTENIISYCESLERFPHRGTGAMISCRDSESRTTVKKRS